MSDDQSDTTSAKAIHLAAGKGSRLRPITNDRPKPLVELGGTTLLERNVETLRAGDINDQIVVTGHCGDQIQNLGYQTVHNPAYGETDMVYSLFCAENEFPTERDLIISYGDIVYEKSVVEALLNADGAINVVVDLEWNNLWAERFDDPLDDAETLKFDCDNRIQEIGGEPQVMDEIEGQYIGLIKIRTDHIERFTERYTELTETEEDEYASVEMTHFIQSMVDDGWDVQAVPIKNGWLEVDTVKDLKMYRERYEQETIDPFVDLGGT